MVVKRDVKSGLKISQSGVEKKGGGAKSEKKYLCLFGLLTRVLLHMCSGTNLNYAPVMVGAVLIFSLSYWFLSARKWFKGPVANVNAKEYDY